MLRINLATRPFYNERVVHYAIALLALTLIAGSVFNVMRIIELSRRNTALGTEATRDELVAAAAGSRNRDAQAADPVVTRCSSSPMSRARRTS